MTMTTLNEVLVFKTNINCESEMQKLAVLLNAIKEIEYWNIDLTDCDRILRVKTTFISPVSIMQLARQVGFMCEELPD
jgi:hypothetical protein